MCDGTTANSYVNIRLSFTPCLQANGSPIVAHISQKGKKVRYYSVCTAHTHVGPLFSTHAGIDVPFPSPHYSPWGERRKETVNSGGGRRGRAVTEMAIRALLIHALAATGLSVRRRRTAHLAATQRLPPPRRAYEWVFFW